MKTTSLYRISLIAILTGIITTGIVSCKKFNDWDIDESANRLFRPSGLSTIVIGVNATLKWSATPGTDAYTIELSKDSLQFTKIIHSYITTGVKTSDDLSYVLPDQLDPQVRYSLRIKGIDSSGKADSEWSSITFMSGKFPTILNTLTISDITDVAVRASWKDTGDAVTTIKILKGSDSSLVQNVTLNGTDVSNKYKVIPGLTPSTAYILYIYSGTTVRGWYDFATKATLSGSIIDLRSFAGVPSILQDTLPDVASGSTIILKKGQTYNMTTTYAFNKTISIISGDDLSTNVPATIYFGSGASNFDVASGSTIDYLTFTNVAFSSDDVSMSGKYVMNIGQACTVGKISFESCTANYFRGFFRTKDNAMAISSLSINNCIISDLGSYGLITVDHANNAVTNIYLGNSTVYRVGATVIKNQKNSLTKSIIIENCTVNEAPLYNNYLVDQGTLNVSSGITIQNCIFGIGKASGANTTVRGAKAGSSTAINSSNNWGTSDYVVTSNAIPGVTAYSSTAATLFASPSTGNFNISDVLFGGLNTAGDPRWRP